MERTVLATVGWSATEGGGSRTRFSTDADRRAWDLSTAGCTDRVMASSYRREGRRTTRGFVPSKISSGSARRIRARYTSA